MVAVTPFAPSVLLVDDEPEILFSFELMLRRAGLNHIVATTDSRAVLSLLQPHEIGVIVLDLQMPHLSGKDLLATITEQHPHIPVIIVTAANELETAVSCMQTGAFDYLVKPIETSRFLACLRKALEIHRLRYEIASLKEVILTGQLRNPQAFSAIRTCSRNMIAVLGYLEAVAPSPQPVLITGETGVGKELVAKSLHLLSGRSGPFIAVNSAGLDDAMFSDTLFGHKKGAFTGAGEARAGMVARAANGTLFLDEIGDLPLPSQIKLLRLLQEGEFLPLGRMCPSSARPGFWWQPTRISKKQCTPEPFRKDLYYRLFTHHVRIPPLRDRLEDIPLLLDGFLQEAAHALNKKKPTCPPELIAYLATYHFPGNVRELKALVFDAVARHHGGVLSMAAFRAVTGEKPAAVTPAAGVAADAGFQLVGRFPSLKEMEAHLVAEALQRAAGNQGAAASLLGISRQALNKRLQRR